MTPLWRQREERSPVRWGGFLGVVALSIIVASFAAGYFYLWSRATVWPPGGQEPPPLGFAGFAALTILVGTAGGVLSYRGEGTTLHLGLAVGWASGVGAGVLLVKALEESGFQPTVDAYGSVSVILIMSLLLVVVSAAVASLVTQARAVVGASPRWLESARAVIAMFWALAVVSAVFVALTVYLIPYAGARP